MTRSPGMRTIGQFEFDNILAGDLRRITEAVELQEGQVYRAGSVLGKITASGLCTLVDSAKTDGSEEIFGVLADDVDATDRDMPAIAFLTGEFNRNRVTFGGSDTYETHQEAARIKNIYFKDAVLRDEQD